MKIAFLVYFLLSNTQENKQSSRRTEEGTQCAASRSRPAGVARSCERREQEQICFLLVSHALSVYSAKQCIYSAKQCICSFISSFHCGRSFAPQPHMDTPWMRMAPPHPSVCPRPLLLHAVSSLALLRHRTGQRLASEGSYITMQMQWYEGTWRHRLDGHGSPCVHVYCVYGLSRGGKCGYEYTDSSLNV